MKKDDKNKIHNYVVVLKNNNVQMIEKTGWLLCLLSLILFISSLYQDSGNTTTYLFIALILAIAVGNAIKKKQRKAISFFTLLCIAGIGIMASTEIPFIGIFIIIAAIMENRLSQKKEIGFSDDGVKFSYGSKKIVTWTELNNVILRDGLLTIDFKDNTLIQADSDDADDPDYEVADHEFNAYCGTQLNKA